MEKEHSGTQKPSRRSMLATTASGLTSIWLATHWTAILSASEHANSIIEMGQPATFGFFSSEEAVEIEAVAAQIIPKDDTPGAREAGTVYFIDRALTTFDHEKQAAYTDGIKNLVAKTHEMFPDIDKFSNLGPSRQIQVLTAIEKTAFFEQVREHTIVGFFANPEYGGNQDKIGWKLIGFEDKFDWQPPFGHYDRESNQG